MKYKQEAQFLYQLEARVSQNKDLLNINHVPDWLKVISTYLLASPWKIILPLAIMIALFLVILFQTWSIKSVSLLQRGF